MRNCITPLPCARCSTSTIGGSMPAASTACPRRRIVPEASGVRRAATFAERPSTRTLMRIVRLSAALSLGVACRSTTPPAAPSAAPQTAVYEPSRALNGLFHDVQLAGVFPDSKTFVDARPLEAPAQITAAYAAERS